MPLPKAKSGNQLVVMIEDRYSRPPRTIPTTKTKATHIATIFLEIWVLPYGIPKLVLTEKGPQFVVKFFSAL